MDLSILKYKSYKHIDKRLQPEVALDLVTDKIFVSKHGFYPFISYSIDFRKYINEPTENGHHYKIKSRPIKYASHIDRYIYQTYSFYLNNYYNDYSIKNNFDSSVVAYRTNKEGTTNIEISRKAFDFVKSTGSCYILVSDFEHFFDLIEHGLLKKNICSVMGESALSDDHYKVFKSMTHYCSIERKDIEDYLLKNGIYSKTELKNCNSYFDKVSWNKVKKDFKDKLYINCNDYGIPQGSSISGIYANVYMIEFDKKITDFAHQNHGLYLRYSDDIILIVPKKNVNDPSDLWNIIVEAKVNYKYLTINKNKTSIYSYDNSKVESLHCKHKEFNESSNCISYLGFSFDGKYIRFRDKTLTKFFYKLYRKIDYMKKSELRRIKKGKRKSKIDKHFILKKLRAGTEERNFFDYLLRAKKVYPNEKYIAEFRNNVINKVFIRFNK